MAMAANSIGGNEVRSLSNSVRNLTLLVIVISALILFYRLATEPLTPDWQHYETLRATADWQGYQDAAFSQAFGGNCSLLWSRTVWCDLGSFEPRDDSYIATLNEQMARLPDEIRALADTYFVTLESGARSQGNYRIMRFLYERGEWRWWWLLEPGWTPR
ncbi:MAG: hypothetical protein SF123_09680 [Chloroflexota bacterium]|nr:hypothetical protein [Chloroflexota bacterium]